MKIEAVIKKISLDYLSNYFDLCFKPLYLPYKLAYKTSLALECKIVVNKLLHLLLGKVILKLVLMPFVYLCKFSTEFTKRNVKQELVTFREIFFYR